MEWAIMTFGGKLCCIFASGCGGLANVLTQKKWNLGAIKDILIAIIVGWIAAEFLIPAAMSHFKFNDQVAIGLAFVIGYCGIRLLPKIEEALMNRIK
tara:strand:- start:13214 stop:13504 length:291 start_codon:yes stop_codon:yes gene_type:complete